MSHIGHLKTDSINQEKKDHVVASCMSMSSENQGNYITVSLENNWTKMRTKKKSDDELRAMQGSVVCVEIPIREAVGGQHIGGCPIVHMKKKGEMSFRGHKGEHGVTRR